MKYHSPFHTSASVLIIKLRAIGDVVLSSPVIANLKNAYPHLQIDYLCETFAADALRGNPYLREIVTFSKKSESSIDLIRKIRSRHYDIIIDLFGNPRTALATRLSGAPVRIGFPFRGRAYAYTVHIPPRGGEIHNVDFNLDVLRYFDIPIQSTEPAFYLQTAENEFSRQWIQENGLLGKEIIGINASGGWSAKKWGLPSFARLIDSIYAERKSSIVLFWGPGEYDDIARVKNYLNAPSWIIPQTTLKEMGAFLSQCSYLISNDSGPMHIAAALGVPTLGIYGPTSPRLQGPYGSKHLWVRREELDCLECNLTACPIGNVCMTGLNVEAVLEAFRHLVSKNEKEL